MPYVLKYISDFNDRGVELKDNDLLLLLFLFEVKVAKQSQLFNFATLLPINPIKNYDSFCRRLKKWETEGLIKRKKYGLLTGKVIHTHLIEIEMKGLALLYLAGILDDFTKNRSVNRKNIEHHIGIVESILQMFRVFSKTDGVILGISTVSEEPFTHPYVFNPYPLLNLLNLPPGQFINKKEQFKIYKNDVKNVKAKYDKPIRSWALKDVILPNKLFLLNSYSHIYSYLKERNLPKDFIKELWPDWIFKNKNHTYCIEIDANTERNPKLLRKIKRYMELSEKDPTQHYTLFFIMLDDSLNMRKMFDSEEIIERLTVLKEEFFVNTFRDDESDPPYISLRNATTNLDVYVLPLERTGVVLNRAVHAVFDNVSNSRKNKYSTINEVRKKALSHLRELSIPVTVLSAVVIKSRNWFISNTKLDYPEPKIGFDCGGEGEIITLFPYVVREGDIKTMDEVSYLADKLSVQNGTFKNAKILAIYEFEDELFNDIKSRVFLSGLEEGMIELYCIETKRFYDKNELIPKT